MGEIVIGWQEVAAGAVVLAAAVWLVRRARRAQRERAACSSCPVAKIPPQPTLGRARRQRH